MKEAEAAFLEAIRDNPEHADAWFNLGLVYKRLRRWEDTRRCNLRAAELDPKNDGALWNLGIAATALGDWRVARDAWRRFGVDIPDGEGPFELPLGAVPIRLNPAGDPEIVWCHRLDPARAVIQNVPLPQSGHRYDDLLLHDGAPNGYREMQGVKVPVFDELELLQASTFTTHRVRIEVRDQDDVDMLHEVLQEHEIAMDDWTTSIRRLCKQCSEGTPHEHAPRRTSATSRELGVAAIDRRQVVAILDAWVAAAPGRSHGPVEVALEGAVRS